MCPRCWVTEPCDGDINERLCHSYWNRGRVETCAWSGQSPQLFSIMNNGVLYNTPTFTIIKIRRRECHKGTPGPGYDL